MSKGEDAAVRLQRAVDTFIERLQRVPREWLTVAPAEGEWTIMELAAHSTEIYPYWAQQVAWLRTHPEQPFGRTAADPDRIRFVEEHKTDSLESLIARMRSSSAEAATALRSYSDAEWTTIGGIHEIRGRMDLDTIDKVMVSGHAEEHLQQLEDTLAALGQGSS